MLDIVEVLMYLISIPPESTCQLLHNLATLNHGLEYSSLESCHTCQLSLLTVININFIYQDNSQHLAISLLSSQKLFASPTNHPNEVIAICPIPDIVVLWFSLHSLLVLEPWNLALNL